LTQIIKKYPQEHPAQQQMGNANQSAQSAASGPIRTDVNAQAGGTENLVFVFGYTFATKIATALRAAGNRFPQHMVETSLMQQIFHQGILFAAAVRIGGLGTAEGG
jgi:hypothetical protein